MHCHAEIFHQCSIAKDYQQEYSFTKSVDGDSRGSISRGANIVTSNVDYKTYMNGDQSVVLKQEFSSGNESSVGCNFIADISFLSYQK